MAHGKTLELRKIKKAPPEAVCVCGHSYDGPHHYTKLGIPRVRGTCKRHLRAGREGVAGVGARGATSVNGQLGPFRKSPGKAAPASFHTSEWVRDVDRGEFYLRRVQRREIRDGAGEIKVVWVPGPRIGINEVI